MQIDCIHETKKVTELGQQGINTWRSVFLYFPLVNPTPIRNHTIKTTWSVLGPPILKQEVQRGPSEDLNTADFPQYSLRSVASQAVLRDLGCIEGRGQTLKCFLVLLSV